MLSIIITFPVLCCFSESGMKNINAFLIKLQTLEQEKQSIMTSEPFTNHTEKSPIMDISFS